MLPLNVTGRRWAPACMNTGIGAGRSLNGVAKGVRVRDAISAVLMAGRTLTATGLTERGARGVAQVPGQGAYGVTESNGLEPRRTENAGVIAPPARQESAPPVDASRSVSPGRFPSHGSEAA